MDDFGEKTQTSGTKSAWMERVSGKIRLSLLNMNSQNAEPVPERDVFSKLIVLRAYVKRNSYDDVGMRTFLV